MLRLTMPVDMTATARIPGTKKSIGFLAVRRLNVDRHGEESSSAGMMMVTSTLSPRRSVMFSSARVCARIICWSGAARCSSPTPEWLARSFAHLLSGQAQEDIFERGAAHAQLAQRHALVAQERRQLDQHRRARRRSRRRRFPLPRAPSGSSRASRASPDPAPGSALKRTSTVVGGLLARQVGGRIQRDAAGRGRGCRCGRPAARPRP